MVVEQPLGHGPQQLLARAMAHIVAHAAEVLQLQQAQRGRDGRAGVGGRVGLLDQAGAREQLRQAVVLQQGAHVLEGFLQPLRHVVECRDQGRGFHHGRVRQRLHRAPVTLGQAVGRVGRHGQGAQRPAQAPQAQRQPQQGQAESQEKGLAAVLPHAADQIGLGLQHQDPPVDAAHIVEGGDLPVVDLALLREAQVDDTVRACPGWRRALARMPGQVLGKPGCQRAQRQVGAFGQAQAHGRVIGAFAAFQHRQLGGVRHHVALRIDHGDMAIAAQGLVAQKAVHAAQPHIGGQHAGQLAGHTHRSGCGNRGITPVPRHRVDGRPVRAVFANGGLVPGTHAGVVAGKAGHGRARLQSLENLQGSLGAAVLKNQAVVAIGLQPHPRVFALHASKAQQADLVVLGIELGE